MRIKKKSYFFLIFCVSFYFLIFDTIIGLFQLLNIIQRGEGILNTEEGQFRLTNLFIDLSVLIGMSLFLLSLWRKLFVEDKEEPFTSYRKLFKILTVIGGISIFLMVILFANPFVMDIDLNRSPIGHIYDTTITAGLIFFMLGIAGIGFSKIEGQKKESSTGDIKNGL